MMNQNVRKGDCQSNVSMSEGEGRPKGRIGDFESKMAMLGELTRRWT